MSPLRSGLSLLVLCSLWVQGCGSAINSSEEAVEPAFTPTELADAQDGRAGVSPQDTDVEDTYPDLEDDGLGQVRHGRPAAGRPQMLAQERLLDVLLGATVARQRPR